MCPLQMYMKLLFTIVLGTTISAPTGAYLMYQTSIPNGVSVPNPCDRTQIWPGVGHRSPSGGDARNPFGLDFAASGHVRILYSLNT